MNTPTSDRLIAVINRVTTERSAAARQDLADDVAVLDEELADLRLSLLKLRWVETSNGRTRQ